MGRRGTRTMNTPLKKEHSNLGFDPDALRDKYRAERDKRMRDDGDDQFLRTMDDYAHYADEDPFVEEPLTRDAIDREVDVVVIGGGFSGMMAAARLKERGVDDVVLIESGADLGGTWYWNRYPGSQCDIESYCYLPLLEELDYMPKEKYSYAPEIYEHCQRIGEYYGLYDLALFQTRVTELRWSEEGSRWRVSTHRGDELRARFVVQAAGTANTPKLPGIEGIHDYQGHSFHTCRWDYDYTGGDHNGGLTKLADKRVGVIGTGCTAIQAVPFLGEHAKELYVFQRTPSSVDARGNSPTDEDWYKSLEARMAAGAARELRRHRGGPPVRGGSGGGWLDGHLPAAAVAAAARGSGGRRSGGTGVGGGDRGFPQDERDPRAGGRRGGRPADGGGAETVVPPVLQAPHVQRRIPRDLQQAQCPPDRRERAQGRGPRHREGRRRERHRVRGGLHHLRNRLRDHLIAARRINFDVIGRGGESLFEHWEKGLQTLHGLSSHGFPNWFFIGVNQNGLSVNMTAMFDDQARHVAYIIDEVLGRGRSVAEVTAEAEAEWVAEIRRLAFANRDFLESCTPGYYNNEGELDDLSKGLATQAYAPGINAFNALLAEWREEGNLEGFEVR